MKAEFRAVQPRWQLSCAAKYALIEPFRVNPKNLRAGDITKQMAVAWQADFNGCRQEGALAGWPAQRPDDVFPAARGEQVPWVRDLVNNRLDIVQKWDLLEFVVKKGQYVETEGT
jgi:hypothetical protein